jgi:hypothetical protein
MSQHYSDPSRENEPYALPDVETFEARHGDCPFCTSTVVEDGCGQFHCENCADGRKAQGVVPEDITLGWFYWSCFPGCLPNSDPVGPFDTEAEALADAQSQND